MKDIRHFDRIADALDEEARLLALVAGGDSDFEAMLWTAGQSLVAPRSIGRLPGFERVTKESAERGWPVALRSSGGGFVPQGPGILNLSLMHVLRGEDARDLASTYRVLTAPICRAASHLGAVSVGPVVGSFCDGNYNVVLDGRKLAGTAQRWTLRRDGSGDSAVLAHAIILCSPGLEDACRAINRLCALSGDKPGVRRDSHVDRLPMDPAAFGAMIMPWLAEMARNSRSRAALSV